MLVDKPSMMAAYRFLCAFEPFVDLPPADEVRFVVTRSMDLRGYFQPITGLCDYEIGVSSRLATHMTSLLLVMAHEMLHLAQKFWDTETAAEHNEEFYRLAHILCQELGWDPGLF